MTSYEKLLDKAEQSDVKIIEKPFKSNAKGLCKGNRIAINKRLKSEFEKSCILAEELGHYHTTSGDIIDQSDITNRKQELHARMWAYNRLIGLTGIISAHKSGCRNKYEMAEHLEVSEEFLNEALECYRSKYGLYAKVDNYIIYFEPSLGVMELL